MSQLKLFLVDKRNLKCMGVVIIDLRRHLRQKVDCENKFLFPTITEAFRVEKMPTASQAKTFGEEIGELEVSISCEFGGYLPDMEPQIRVPPSQEVASFDRPRESKPVKDIHTMEMYRLQTEEDSTHEISQLILKTQKVIDDIDENVALNKDSKLEGKIADMKVKNVIPDLSGPHTTKKLSPEAELEIVRIQRKMMQEWRQEAPQKEETIRTEAEKQVVVFEPISLDVRLISLCTSSEQLTKFISDNVCYIQLSFMKSNQTVHDSHKLVNQNRHL